MGWEGRSFKITALLDAHGGEKETEHERLWEQFVAEIIKVVEDPRFEEIRPGSTL